MGGIISKAAFPRPELALRFYERRLLLRDDLIFFRTSWGEKIPAIHIRSGGADAPTLLYSHGNAEDLALAVDGLEYLAEVTGANVLCYEYVGYSLSRFDLCDPSEAACYRSIDAAWCYLTESVGVPPERIVLCGRSIGSGPAVDLASRAAPHATAHGDAYERVAETFTSPQRCAGVLLQSPIESGIRAVGGWFASKALYSLDLFRSYEKVPGIAAPIAITHGTADRVVPCANGRALAALARELHPPLWIEGSGHNDMSPRAVAVYAREFLETLGSAAVRI